MTKLKAVTLQNAPCFLDNTGKENGTKLPNFRRLKSPKKKKKKKKKKQIFYHLFVKEAAGEFKLIVSSVSTGEALRNDAQRQDRGIVHEIIVLTCYSVTWRLYDDWKCVLCSQRVHDNVTTRCFLRDFFEHAGSLL